MLETTGSKHKLEMPRKRKANLLGEGDDDDAPVDEHVGDGVLEPDRLDLLAGAQRHERDRVEGGAGRRGLAHGHQRPLVGEGVGDVAAGVGVDAGRRLRRRHQPRRLGGPVAPREDLLRLARRQQRPHLTTQSKRSNHTVALHLFSIR